MAATALRLRLKWASEFFHKKKLENPTLLQDVLRSVFFATLFSPGKKVVNRHLFAAAKHFARRFGLLNASFTSWGASICTSWHPTTGRFQAIQFVPNLETNASPACEHRPSWAFVAGPEALGKWMLHWLNLHPLESWNFTWTPNIISIQILQGVYRQAIGSVTAIIPTQIHGKSNISVELEKSTSYLQLSTPSGSNIPFINLQRNKNS